MAKTIIEMMDDMHLSSQATFLNYYNAMQSNNVSSAINILSNNTSLANQIITADNINLLLTETYRRELIPKTDIDYYLAGLHAVYEKMILFTRVRGEWVNTEQYEVHNLVYYQGKGYYVYTNEAPPIGTLPTDTNYWLEYDIKGFQGYGGININLKYNWDSTIDYKIGDIVIYQNKLWYALANNSNDVPDLNHYPWVIISMPQMPNKTPIQRSQPQKGYDIGDFWFQITEGEEVITTTWGTRQSEPTPRFASGSCTIDKNIYIIGGLGTDFSVTNTNEVYDVETGTWSSKLSSPTYRARFACFEINEIIYCCGGINENGIVLNTVESYNPISNTWNTVASLPIPFEGEGISNGTLGYILGGMNSTGSISGKGYSYNPISNSWTEIATKPTLTKGHTLVYNNNIIYCIGGIDNLENTLNIMETYDILSNTYSTKASMITPRSYLASFFQYDKIYAVGGLNSNGYGLNINEKYDIENNEWVSDMPMNYPRSSLNAQVSGSKAFAIGGVNIGISAVNGYVEQYNVIDLQSEFDMTINTKIGNTLDFAIGMASGGSYNYWIDWGDGTTSSQIITYNDINAQHTYSEDGIYIVKLVGTANKLLFNSPSLISIDKCALTFYNIDQMFFGCTNLNSIPTGIFDYSPNLTSAMQTFHNCTNLTIIPTGLFSNNIQISNFSNTFNNTGIITLPNSLFTNNNLATRFDYCFANCTGLTNIPQNLFSTNILANQFDYCFANCTGLTTLPNNLFNNNTSTLNFNNVFRYCNNLISLPSNLFGNGALGVTNFSNAFYGCKFISLPEGLFINAISCINYNNVFYGVPITQLPNNLFNGQAATISNGINTSIITNIGNKALNGLNIPTEYLKNKLSLITVGNDIFSSNVNNLENMFSGCSNLTTLGNIDMSEVTNITSMLSNCTSLTNLNGFKDRENHSNPTLHDNFTVSDNSNLTHDSLINISNSLVILTPTTSKNLDLGSANLNKLTNIEKFVIVNKYWNLLGWTLPTITQSLAGDIASAVKAPNITTSKIYEGDYSTSLYWRVSLSYTNGTFIGEYLVDKSTGLVYNLDEEPIKEYKFIYTTTSSSTPQTLFVSKTSSNDVNGTILKDSLSTLNSSSNLLKTIEVSNSSNITNFTDTFLNFSNLTTARIETYNAITMNKMFSGCTNLTTANVSIPSSCTNTYRMFYNCTKLVNYPTFLSTSNVTTMEEMFYYNTMMSSTPNLNMTNVTNSNKMFQGCSNLKTLNITNVGKITNASYMFSVCSSLNSMPSLTFSNVTNADSMFRGSGFTSVPNSISLPKAQNVSHIFENCSNLTTITSGFFSNTITTAIESFKNCVSLVNMPTDIKTVFGTNSNLTDVTGLFNGCSALKKVGEHFIFKWEEDPIFEGLYNAVIDNNLLDKQLFRNCPNITNMSYIFMNCTNLGNQNMTIPEQTEPVKIGLPIGFFYWCTKVTNISHCFDGCKNIINHLTNQINPYLFEKNTLLTNVSYAFANSNIGDLSDNEDAYGGRVFGKCTKIQNASYLFSNADFNYYSSGSQPCFIYNSLVLTNIEGMYNNVKSLMTIPYMGQYAITGMDWSKLNLYMPALQNCSKLFYGCTNLTGNTGDNNVLTVINSLNSISTLTNHSQSFYNCTTLPNYSSIPTGWK